MARQHRAGKAVRLAAGVYVIGATLPPEDLARRHLYKIIAHFWPGAVICDRSAFDGASSDSVFVCHPKPPRAANLALPGVTVFCRPGPGPLPGDMPMPEELHLSGVARGLLENADVGGRPPKNRPSRAAGLAAVGDQIDTLAADRNPNRLSSVLAQFDAIRGHFSPSVAEQVRRLLAAAQGTYQGERIDSERLAARVSGNPFDAARVGLFTAAADRLSGTSPIIRSDLRSDAEREWLPFFESYFSNDIEGTRFSVEEAYAIAIEGQVPHARPEDARDVEATYRIVKDVVLMSEVPRDVDDFMRLLQGRHRILRLRAPTGGQASSSSRRTTPGQPRSSRHHSWLAHSARVGSRSIDFSTRSNAP